jgi:hypothetical protein
LIKGGSDLGPLAPVTTNDRGQWPIPTFKPALAIWKRSSCLAEKLNFKSLTMIDSAVPAAINNAK